MSRVRIIVILCLCSAHILGLSKNVLAADKYDSQADPPEEVGLSFRYEGGINNVVVTAYYWNDKFYLPVNSLFSILSINHQFDTNEKKVYGYYLNKGNQYVLDFKNRTGLFKKQSFSLKKSEFIVGKLDYYLLPEVFAKIFNLHFTVDFSQLSLSLKTPDTMPIVTLYQQQLKRSNISSHSFFRPDYPIVYHRKRHLLDGGFLDYNGNVNISKTGNVYGYDLRGGAEILGGDFQGNILGSYNNGSTYFNSNNIRWRYGIMHNPYISQVSVGQLYTDGFYNANYVGVKVTNQPLNFRYSYVNYDFRGKSEPGSDVELYVNGQLVEFKKSDDLGNYDFNIPLVYGNSLVTVKIFGPYGTIRTVEKRIQIPYTYLKPGEFNYFLDAGELQYPLPGELKKDKMLQSGFIYGFNDWLTDKIGMDYIHSPQFSSPVVYNSLSARIAKQYLTSLDVAPNNFYRLNLGVFYPSLASWQFNLAHYNGNTLYNNGAGTNTFSGTMYVPFHLGNMPLSWLFGTNGNMYSNYTLMNYTTSLIFQVQGASFQLGYNERRIFAKNVSNKSQSYLNTTLTYNFYNQIPVLRGTTIRTELMNQMNPWRVGRLDIQAAKSIRGRYQFTLGLGRDFQVKYSFLNVGFQINLDKVQSTMTYQNSGGQAYLGESVRGSLGYDSQNREFVLTNRPEVGAAAASVRYYVDANNNGRFDKGEKVLKDNVLQLWRSTTSYQDKKGIVHYFSLRPYNKYNAKINTDLISNPILLPNRTKFAFETDPNDFKTINIPFYMTGVISGNVVQLTDTTREPLAGVQVLVHSLSGDFKKTLQTFNDGSFYSMGIPAGEYAAKVDSSQLSFLNAKSIPSVLHFKVKALPNGDFIDSLNFVLEPKNYTPDSTKAKPDTTLEIKQQASLSEPKPSPKSDLMKPDEQVRYYVELRKYLKFDKSAKELFTFKPKLRDSLFIAYNEENNMFGIFTDGVKEKDKADLIKKKYQTEGFEDALLISKKKPYLQKLKYAIQLGAFSDKKSANQFSKETSRLIIPGNSVVYDKSLKMYKVILAPGSNIQDIFALKKKLQCSVNYRNAFIVPYPDIDRTHLYEHHYFVQLGAFSNRDSAAVFAKKSEQNLHLETDLQKVRDRSIYKVVTLPLKKIKDAVELKSQISSIKTFKNAFIITDSTRLSHYDQVRYLIQLGAFKNRQSSILYAKSARKKYGLNVRYFLKDETNLYTVQLGPIKGWKQARCIQKDFLKSKKYNEAMLLLEKKLKAKQDSYWGSKVN